MANVCGAKNRKGTPCQKPAGWGTKHNGTGKCKFHGGSSTGPPKGTQNALKHGLFAKHIPADTLELVESLEQEDTVAKLRRNIAIQEAAIIRSQNIMYVESKNEMIKELKKESSGDKMSSEEWEFQFAWDRQGAFMTSLSRAMGTLTNMYKALHELTGEKPPDPKDAFKQFADALNAKAKEVWADEEEEE